MVVVWRPHYQVSKEVINMERNEVNHSAHSTWRCQYHIVFAPKFRRKAIYGQLKVRRKESGNHRSGGMCRPHPYARKYSTASKCSTIHGISQGKKHANDIRSSRKSQIQVWEQALLVPWLLCRHGRKEQESNRGIHPQPARRG